MTIPPEDFAVRGAQPAAPAAGSSARGGGVAAAPEAGGRVAGRRGPWLALVALGLALIAALVVTFVTVSDAGHVERPEVASADGGITIEPGSAAMVTQAARGEASPPLHLDLFTDYTHPDSARFSTVNALVIQSFAQQGALEVSVHPVAVGESPEQRQAAIVAGNAVACVAEHSPHDVWAYHVGLLAVQPTRGSAPFDGEDLVALARDSGVAALDKVTGCIVEQRFADWIDLETDAAVAEGVGEQRVRLDRVPLVLADGTPYLGRLESSEEFRAFVDFHLAN